MMLEFEVTKSSAEPFLWKPGYIRTNVQRRVWWGYFAVCLTKGSAWERHQKIAAGERVWV